jgi:hypothetical protein
LLTLAGVIAWIAIAAITWAGAAPLGHDESQYAIAGRDALEGLPARWWFYVSRGMTVVAAPGILLGESERALRFVPLLIGGVGFALATWMLARRSLATSAGAAAATAVGGVALLVMASSRNVVRYASDLLSDFPSAACLLAALAILVDEVDRDDEGPRWRIVLAAPAFAAAMYVRYGSVLPIAVIVLAALVVGGRAIRRRPLPVIATAGMFLVLLVPHFIEAHGKTGSPLGILLIGREVPQDEYFGQGLVTYVASNPFKLYGLTIPIALLAGIVAIVRAARERDRRRLLVWIAAVGSLVAVGLTTHAQVRYILVSLALLSVLGVDELRYWISRLPARTGRVVIASGLAVVLALWTMLAVKHVRADDNRVARMRGTLAAAAAIRADAAGARCMVLGNHYTQLEWYSGCRAPLVISPQSTELAAAQRRGDRVYIVRDHGAAVGKEPQPVFASFAGTPTLILERPNVVEVARLDAR